MTTESVPNMLVKLTFLFEVPHKCSEQYSQLDERDRFGTGGVKTQDLEL